MRLEVKGSNELRELKRPYLICPNHQSFLDPFVVCSLYPFQLFRNFFHVGASEFFEGRIMRAVAALLNVVPVNPDSELMRAMKAGAIGLKAGKVLNIILGRARLRRRDAHVQERRCHPGHGT